MEQTIPANTPVPKKRSWIIVVIKIAISGICLWYVSQKIDWLVTWHLLSGSQKGWLLLAAMFFVLSKMVSALRLNIYFKNIEVQLSQPANLRLYWLGMFYNLFLPGGIGGDAYKVIVLNKQYPNRVKKLSSAVLLDRISGVVGLGILGGLYYFFIFKGQQYSWWLLAGILPAIVVYYWFVKKVFLLFLQSFANTLWLGIAVQFLQVLCVYCLMLSIQIHQHQSQYVLLFLLSSVVAILPFTVGGLGAREVVFLWGSQHFGLNSQQSVYISILFYLITAAVSFIGLRWVCKNPLK